MTTTDPPSLVPLVIVTLLFASWAGLPLVAEFVGAYFPRAADAPLWIADGGSE